MNTGKELSLRQVLAAVTLAGLSLAASQAGVVDWAWGLVGTAAAVPLLRWLMLRQGDKSLCRGGYGVVLWAMCWCRPPGGWSWWGAAKGCPAGCCCCWLYPSYG